MTTLLEIQAAAEALPPAEKRRLFDFLSVRLHSPAASLLKARLVRQHDDTLLEAPADAPPMTPENVKQMLEDWP